MDQNNVSLVGRMADDPKLYPNDDPNKTRAWWRLAVNRDGRKDAEGKDIVDWIPCTAFGKKAVAIVEYCHKGKEVAVNGEMHEDSRPLCLANGQQLVHPETSKPLYDNYYEVLASKVSFGRDSRKFLAAKAAKAATNDTAPAPTAPTASAPVAPTPTTTAPAFGGLLASAPLPQQTIQQTTPELLDAITASVMAQMRAEADAKLSNPLGEMA